MLQYSRLEWAMVLYAAVFIGSVALCRYRQRKSSMLFAFLAVLSIWFFNVRLDCRSTPRYLVEASVDRLIPFS